PIIIRAKESDAGKVIIKNTTLTLSGTYGVVTGLIFDNSMVQVSGNYNRVSRNVFRNGTGKDISAAISIHQGSYNRVDYNEIVDWQKRGIRVIPKGSKKGGKDDTSTQHNRIDHNYLHKFEGNQTNGTEGIQLGKGMNNTFVKLLTVVEYNLLDQVINDDEVVSIKSSENVVQFNTFINSDVTMQVRHGFSNQFISNINSSCL
ncbi:MAG: hypothetical protein ETSY1_45800, partial [Candidatus Entotheonella factor]